MGFYETAKEIDSILRGVLTPKKVNKLLALIRGDISYENYFLKEVKDVKWFLPIKREGYFNPNKNPCPAPAGQEGSFIIPEWNVLPYLERVSEQTTKPGNEKYIHELLTIIKEVSNYKDSRGQHTDNYRTWWYFVKILLNIPSKEIAPEIIELIPIWLDSKFDATVPGSEIATRLLPKFMTDNPEDIIKAEKIIEAITAIKTYPLSEEKAKIFGKREEKKLVVDPYWLKEVFDEKSEIIGMKCSKRLIEDLGRKIRSLLTQPEDGVYKSFYEEWEHLTDDPLEMLTLILKRVLLAKARTDVNIAKVILGDFLKDKYLFFLKMAIYIIGQDIDHYGELFWETMKSETGELIMGNALYFGDELKYLLKNLEQLSEEQRDILKNKIEQGIKRYVPKAATKRDLASFKQQIYQALSHDSYFKDLYEEMKKVTNRDAELHPAIGKTRMRWGSGPPPLTKEQILRMPNTELAEFFSKFKSKDSWEGPTVGGLSDALKEAVKTDPNKFVDDLHAFENIGFIYIYKILDGLKDILKEKKIINWGKIFEFITPYITKPQFWRDEYIVEEGRWLGGANHDWVIGVTAELLQEGTRDDSWAFPQEYFEKAGDIIFTLLKEYKKEKEDITDYVTYTLNTTCGKLVTALVYLALRSARVDSKKGIEKEPKWDDKYRNKYDEMLEKEVIEAYTNLGRYLPNLSYLDSNWVRDKIKILVSKRGKELWEAFIGGYLSVGTVYDELYDMMKPHYEYGISYEFKEKRNKEHLIQHVCIGYLRDHERLDNSDSLFRKIVDAWKPGQIKEIIGFFWMQRHYLEQSSNGNQRTKEKIISFWRKVYERYGDRDEKSLSQEDKKILSSVSRLAMFLPQITAESNEWLMLSATYVHEDFNSAFLIEYLDELKDKGDRKETARYIAQIYLRMLEKITPDFDKKHICSIIEFLYNSDAQENASKICNIYGSRGQEFLRDIYEKYVRKP
jgi:hypothetical protein